LQWKLALPRIGIKFYKFFIFQLSHWLWPTNGDLLLSLIPVLEPMQLGYSTFRVQTHSLLFRGKTDAITHPKCKTYRHFLLFIWLFKEPDSFYSFALLCWPHCHL
jgi:hypothetical protein